MAWRETLLQMREELAEVRSQRRRQYEAEQAEIRLKREELSRLARTLGIVELLEDIKEILLDGRGEIEHVLSWEPIPEHDELGGPEMMLEEELDEEPDVLSEILTWEEGGENELAVDLGAGEDGIYLQVNGVDIRTDRDALEQALIEGFRDELNV